MKPLNAKFVQDFIRMSNDGWLMGWHERNGGNLSYRIKKGEVDDIQESLKPLKWCAIEDDFIVPDLAGEFFLVTAAGAYFRNITLCPEKCMGIIEINKSGTKYRQVWGFEGGGEPSSELYTHLLNQEEKKLASDGRCRVMYHAHPSNTIALTFILPLDGRTFTRELWQMISECAMVFPEGVGVVRWMTPGSLEIAYASANLMADHDVVIWAHHGMFCAGDTFDAAFGLMSTVEKAAEILVKVKSMQARKTQSITSDDLNIMSDTYNLKLAVE